VIEAEVVNTGKIMDGYASYILIMDNKIKLFYEKY